MVSGSSCPRHTQSPKGRVSPVARAAPVRVVKAKDADGPTRVLARVLVDAIQASRKSLQSKAAIGVLLARPSRVTVLVNVQRRQQLPVQFGNEHKQLILHRRRSATVLHRPRVRPHRDRAHSGHLNRHRDDVQDGGVDNGT